MTDEKIQTPKIHPLHAFAPSDAYGGCLTCGMHQTHKIHRPLMRHDIVTVTEPYIAAWAMGQAGKPGGFPCLPGMVFTFWRHNATFLGQPVVTQPPDGVTLVGPGGSKLYDVPLRILRPATDAELRAFAADAERAARNADCPRDPACSTVGPHAADECVIPTAPKDPTEGTEDPTTAHERSNEPVGQGYVRTMLDRAGRAAAELADRVAHEPRDWPGTAPVATAFFKPGGKFYTDARIGVPPSPFLDFVAAWKEHPRVQHFHRQGFYAVARFAEHPDGFPVLHVPEEVRPAGLEAVARQLEENAERMVAAAELLTRALAALDTVDHADVQLTRDIRRLLFGRTPRKELCGVCNGNGCAECDPSK